MIFPSGPLALRLHQLESERKAVRLCFEAKSAGVDRRASCFTTSAAWRAASRFVLRLHRPSRGDYRTQSVFGRGKQFFARCSLFAIGCNLPPDGRQFDLGLVHVKTNIAHQVKTRRTMSARFESRS
jgi:hypothetical protein